MSNFDVSLLPVLPDGGAGAVSSGAFGGSPGEAPPDAFAQLLEELAGEVPQAFMGLPKPALSGVPVGEAELDTVALSISADGWEQGDSNVVSDSSSDDQDAPTTVALMATIAPVVLPEVAEGSREAKAAISQAKGETAQAPVVAGAFPETSEPGVTTPVPQVDGETPFEVPAGREDRALGKIEARAGEQPSGRDVNAVNADLQAHLDRARIAAIENAATHSGVERSASDAERGAGPARGASAASADRASFVESRTAPTAAPVVPAEASTDFGRRQDSRGEQSGLAARTYEGIGGQPGVQPLAVEHAFSRAVTAAQAVANVSGIGVAGEVNALESQIVQGMQRLRRDGVEEIRVTLRPEYLGALTISLRVEHDSVTAVMHVDEPQVRAWVQAHESQLRQALSSQGLTLERLVVTDERPGSDNRERDDQARQGRRPNRQRDGEDAAPNFEVVA